MNVTIARELTVSYKSVTTTRSSAFENWKGDTLFALPSELSMVTTVLPLVTQEQYLTVMVLLFYLDTSLTYSAEVFYHRTFHFRPLLDNVRFKRCIESFCQVQPNCLCIKAHIAHLYNRSPTTLSNQ